MKPPAGRARSAAALASAAITLVAIWSYTPAGAQPTLDPWDGSAFTGPVGDVTSATAVFSGTFKHKPPAQIDSIKLDVAPSPDDPQGACEPMPPAQTSTSTSTTTPSASTPTTVSTSTDPPFSSIDFSFDVHFECNGFYDAIATANDSLDPNPGVIVLKHVHVAVSPPPASGPGTTDALVVDGTPGSVPGNNAGGSAPASGQTSGAGGATHFDEPTTLAADEGEVGAGDPLAALPGGNTIQRFAGSGGAGLVKPFAAALDLGVWALLLLFLTRRAASAERAAALTIELEHPS